MKTHAIKKGGLDIHFISMDSINPNVMTKTFSEENVEMIKKGLHEQFGHLADEIRKSKGYINIYTHEDAVVGAPQFVNFSKEVWDKINYPVSLVPPAQYESLVDLSKGDYLDHESYMDL